MFRKAALLFALVAPASLRAASYLPLPDADLVRRSPIVVDADVLGGTHLTAQRPGEAGPPYSLVPLRVRENLKGETGAEILLRLPGGIAPNGARSVVYGTPTFEPGARVVLFLAPLSEPGQYTLTEFALSKFDVLEDDARQLFAVRSTFQAGDDVYLSSDAGGQAEPDAVRELPSLLAAVRSAHGSAVPEVRRGRPVGTMRPSSDGRTPLWVNIGGVEGINNLFRWFWTTGASVPATVKVVGTQSLLTDLSNGLTHIQNAVTQWSSIPSTNVQVSGPGATGVVTINLDVDSSSGSWSTPMDCSYGVLGVGGPGLSFGGNVFNGEAYFAPNSGDVSMRRSTCTSSGYEAAIFRSAVMHELGHALCLGHPDLKQSTHSTTTSADWNAAVMRSSISAARPSTPQVDDTQAMQYLYPSAAGCTYSINPASTSVGASAASGSVTVTTTAGCTWTAASNAAFLTVTSGASGNGSGTVGYSVSANTGAARSGTLTVAGKTFTVSQAAAAGGGCVANATNLCLLSNRFRVSVNWLNPYDGGSTGVGTAIPLTSDTGAYWFFSSSNYELMIKILDGRSTNGKFWVFYGALSDVEYTITITDTQTSLVKTYFNPGRTLGSKADINAINGP